MIGSLNTFENHSKSVCIYAEKSSLETQCHVLSVCATRECQRSKDHRDPLRFIAVVTCTAFNYEIDRNTSALVIKAVINCKE